MFAKVIRKRNYITFIDAIQQRFGHLTGLIVLLISVLGSILYIASILLSLGATVSVVLDIGLIPSTIASVTIVVLYTFFGGLKSVAYTDIVQLPCIVIGLVLAIPFAISHPAVSDVIENSNRWSGEWQEERTAEWIDSFIILILGAIPVDVFLQRLLSAKTTKIANMSAVFSTCAVLALSLPPIFIGAIGANTDWSLTSYARHFGNVTNGTQASPPYSMTLPMVLQYLTPTWVAVISLGSVSAAVMSSMDSALIAVGSEMAINVYKPLLRPKAGGREIVWVIRVCVVLTAVISTVIALTADSIYSLFYIIGDLGGVILFPQFLCAVYLPSTNTYGSLFGFVAGIVLRLGGGDYFLKLPPFIKYPYYSDISGQLFPFKSFSALCTFLVVVFISYLTKFLFAKGILPQWMDFFRCFKSSYNLDAKNVEVSMDAKFDVKKQNTEADYTCANLGFQK